MIHSKTLQIKYIFLLKISTLLFLFRIFTTYYTSSDIAKVFRKKKILGGEQIVEIIFIHRENHILVNSKLKANYLNFFMF